MSKLSFRARQLDAYKAMPVYRTEEIPEVADVSVINRAVPQMPTGMEKEEETEHHLQRALSAQQVYGTSGALVIPVPEIDDVKKQYEQIYKTDYKTPKQYIHAQSLGVDQEIPDYDIDSEDEAWLENQSTKMEITPQVFEQMIDRLEKGSGQQVLELKDAKVLLKEDDDLIITVYDYWLNKRLKCTPHTLIPTVKSEKRDGSTTNNPYVAFRRRTEKMQTRKNRKNDEVSYEKMLKLRRDLQRAVTVLEMIKKREKCKKELLNLTIEILDKRYDMEDYTGAHLAHAESQKAPRSAFYPIYQEQVSKDSSETTTNRKHKRKYEKKKHKLANAQFQGEVDVMEYGNVEDDPLSPGAAHSDQDDDAHPDGVYAFRRKKFCNYHAPLDTCGNWPWHSQHNGGHADKKYRYSLTAIDTGPETRTHIGFARRRVGRGGRAIFDRAYSEKPARFWDNLLDASIPDNKVSADTVKQRLQENSEDMNLSANNEKTSFEHATFQDFISENKWLNFFSTPEYDNANSLFREALLDTSPDDLINTLDPIIDIIPEPTLPPIPPPSTELTSTTPIVETIASSLTEHSNQVIVAPNISKSVLTTHNNKSSSEIHTISTTSSGSLLESEGDSHRRQLQALKKDQRSSLPLVNSSLTTRTVKRTTESGSTIVTSASPLSSIEKITTATNSVSSSANPMVEPSKASYAVSALINGQAAVRGNGIKQLNGPSIKGELKHPTDVNSTNINISSLKKLHYPLTPSSDTSDITSSADLIHITSLPGESGDTATSRQIIVSNKEYTDSAGLNSIPDVASTMEVS